MEEFEARLVIVNGWIYVLAKGELIKISSRRLRYDGIPHRIMEYAVMKSPNEYVTSFHLEDEGIKTSRDLSQVAYSAGFSGLVKRYFLADCTREIIKIIDKVVLNKAEVEALINDIKQRKASA